MGLMGCVLTMIVCVSDDCLDAMGRLIFECSASW